MKVLKFTMLSLIMLSINLSSVFAFFWTGYTSRDGEELLKYLEPSELKILTEKPISDIWIIDVRPERSYLKGHIPTAKSFPSSEIMDRLNELPMDVSLIVYCETGGRAQLVIKKLEKEGYTKMMNWGGYTRWPYQLVTD